MDRKDYGQSELTETPRFVNATMFASWSKQSMGLMATPIRVWIALGSRRLPDVSDVAGREAAPKGGEALALLQAA